MNAAPGVRPFGSEATCLDVGRWNTLPWGAGSDSIGPVGDLPRYQAHSFRKIFGMLRRCSSPNPAYPHARIATLEVHAATVGEVSPIPPLNRLFPFREYDSWLIAGSGSHCYC